MSGVMLSSGIGAILQSLQQNAAAAATIHARLATGRKVNSALDNPTAYFTAQSLGQRAQDLEALLDGIGQAQQSLGAASRGIDAIGRLVQAAQSVARQAQQAPGPQVSYDAIAATGSANAAETFGSVTGSVDVSGGACVDGLQISVGGTTYTVHQASAPANESIAAVVNDINATPGLGASGAVRASLDNSGKHIQLTATSTDVSFQVLASQAATALGIGNTTGTSTNLLQAVGGLSGASLTVQANGNGPTTINFGTGGGQVSTFAELANALIASGVSPDNSGGPLSLNVDGSVGTRNSLSVSGSALAALGIAGGTQYGAVDTTNNDATRASLQAQYNALLQQIDTLAGDATYAGTGLLRGDTLSATFNEHATSTMTVAGVHFDAAGLGLTVASGSDFQSNDVIASLVTSLDSALVTLRTQSATFGANLTTLQARQDFTKSLTNTLQNGRDALVLADSNEEGAHLLALQTRQDLSLTALSLSARSEQSVLSLFR